MFRRHGTDGEDGPLSLFQDRRLAPTGSLSTSISPAAIKDANEAVKSAVTPRSKSRGAYAKHTPEQQAAIGKYASMHGNKAAVRHLTRVERRYNYRSSLDRM